VEGEGGKEAAVGAALLLCPCSLYPPLPFPHSEQPPVGLTQPDFLFALLPSPAAPAPAPARYTMRGSSLSLPAWRPICPLLI
jgi:hypothetical protein